MDRSRRFLLQAGLLGAGAVSLGLTAWFIHRKEQPLAPLPEPLGRLSPVRDESTGLNLLCLPDGFRYHTLSWAGEILHDGRAVPGSADGMAVVRTVGSAVTLVRNHELRGSAGAFGPPELAYDVTGGGTTNLVFDTRSETLLDSWASLSGTLSNCAGGLTPWGTWLTCEEGPWSPTTRHLGPTLRQSLWNLDLAQKEHGFVFEVAAEGVSRPLPLLDMGQFYHEAIAFDVNTGIIYLTEDATPAAGFYRFLPDTEGDLADGGKLQMMRVENGWDMRGSFMPGERWAVSWIDVEDPHHGITPETGEGDALVRRTVAAGASPFVSLEGCIAQPSAQGTRIIFTAKAGGSANAGCIFEYDPVAETVQLILDSPGHDTLSGPDNITVSPRGSLVICEDRTNSRTMAQSLFGLTRQGQLFRFCQVNPELSGHHAGFRLASTALLSEWAGVTFSEDGDWLFCNLYRPGLTIAITGPWQDGLI